MARRKKRSRRRPAMSVVGDVLAAGVLIDGFLQGGSTGTTVPVAGNIRHMFEQVISTYIPQVETELQRNILSGMLGALVLKKSATVMHKAGLRGRAMGFTV